MTLYYDKIVVNKQTNFKFHDVQPEYVDFDIHIDDNNNVVSYYDTRQ